MSQFRAQRAATAAPTAAPSAAPSKSCGSAIAPRSPGELGGTSTFTPVLTSVSRGDLLNNSVKRAVGASNSLTQMDRGMRERADVVAVGEPARPFTTDYGIGGSFSSGCERLVSSQNALNASLRNFAAHGSAALPAASAYMNKFAPTSAADVHVTAGHESGPEPRFGHMPTVNNNKFAPSMSSAVASWSSSTTTHLPSRSAAHAGANAPARSEGSSIPRSVNNQYGSSHDVSTAKARVDAEAKARVDAAAVKRRMEERERVEREVREEMDRQRAHDTAKVLREREARDREDRARDAAILREAEEAAIAARKCESEKAAAREREAAAAREREAAAAREREAAAARERETAASARASASVAAARGATAVTRDLPPIAPRAPAFDPDAPVPAIANRLKGGAVEASFPPEHSYAPRVAVGTTSQLRSSVVTAAAHHSNDRSNDAVSVSSRARSSSAASGASDGSLVSPSGTVRAGSGRVGLDNLGNTCVVLEQLAQCARVRLSAYSPPPNTSPSSCKLHF
jgi:hypothetical protein